MVSRASLRLPEVDGLEATVLWAKYLRGDTAALENLIEYNTEDVVHLKAIMEICYDKMSERTGEFLQFDSVSVCRSLRGTLARRFALPPG